MKNNKVIISTEGVTISIESSEIQKKPDEANITLDKLVSVTDTFDDVCSKSEYSDEDIAHLEDKLNFELGPKTKSMLKTIGNLTMNDFEVPDADGLIKLTNKWKNSVAKDNEISKYIVIEADGDDFTLLDSNDMIFVYDGKSKETSAYDEDVITHITKHVMAKIVGDEYEY